ncbi:MAG TPA: S8 family serine peptidase [Fimbriimonas sp.]|nr:S8 family serine peptidase [Fimbriimonas sp.]
MIRWIALALAFSSVAVVEASPTRIAPNIPTGRKNETIPGFIKVKYSPSVAARIEAQAQSTAPKSPSRASFFKRMRDTGWVLYKYPTILSYKAVRDELAQNPDAKWLEPLNKIYPLLSEPNDPDWNYEETSETYILSFSEDPWSFRRMWHMDDISAFGGWTTWPAQWFTSATKSKTAPLIAIIDTGCDMNHPDFINAGGTSTNSANGGQITTALSKQFSFGEVLVGGNPKDLNGHGTHVAGLALAAGNNGAFNGMGTIGTGYGCRGMILRVFDDQGSGSDWDAVGAMYYAMDNKAAVINLSLGTENFSLIFQDAVTAAFQKGSLIVAAGNEDGSGGGDLGPIYPAACSGALAVQANGPYQIPATATYSGTGNYVDVAAPGGDLVRPDEYTSMIQFVWSTAMRTRGTLEDLSDQGILYPPYTRNYTYLAGTSMATPIVSGAAGSYFGLKKWTQGNWNNVATYQAIEQTSDGVMGAPNGGWEPYQGYGSLNMDALLNAYNRPAAGGGFEGMIFYEGTPVQNGRIAAKKVGGTFTYTTTSKADGTYRFDIMPPATYNVTATIFGKIKTRQIQVKAGCDMPGVDFWNGTYTGDETDPVFVSAVVQTPTATSIKVKHFAYDTETGIEKIIYRIGTTSGGAEAKADTEIAQRLNVTTLSGFTLTPGLTYYLKLTYINGAGVSVSVIRSFIPV